LEQQELRLRNTTQQCDELVGLKCNQIEALESEFEQAKAELEIMGSSLQLVQERDSDETLATERAVAEGERAVAEKEKTIASLLEIIKELKTQLDQTQKSFVEQTRVQPVNCEGSTMAGTSRAGLQRYAGNHGARRGNQRNVAASGEVDQDYLALAAKTSEHRGNCSQIA
jgi:hypothetical protein